MSSISAKTGTQFWSKRPIMLPPDVQAVVIISSPGSGFNAATHVCIAEVPELTAIPYLTNNNLPLDTIEALAWGSNLDWGFNKHPPMSAFLVEIFYQIFGAQDWAYYLLSQICVIISFFVVFKLAEEFFENKVFCLLSVLLLEGIYFYNFTTPEFNVNVCQIPFWTLTVYFSWKIYSSKEIKLSDCFFIGLFGAIGFLSKYENEI